MTFEQLSVFVAVAEREHLTRAAAAIHLTPSAVSASVKALEAGYNVDLFHRVGRRIELTAAGRAFLPEARAVLERARAAALMLSELGGLRRGTLAIWASQTIASYWLPERLMRFHAQCPGIELRLSVGNTRAVAEAVTAGTAEIGFIEGEVHAPALESRRVARDVMVVVTAPDHPLAARRRVTARALATGTAWVLREPGSGTRSEFEAALAAAGVDPHALDVTLELSSNEAVLSAVRTSRCATAISRAVAAPFLEQGTLVAVKFPLPPRHFLILRHRERHPSNASRVLEQICAKA